MSHQPDSSDKPDSSSEHRRHPLPITIVPGMQVVDMTGFVAGTIGGFTQAFCIYNIESHDNLSVANWRDVAIGPVCPAEPLLPTDVTENDRRNASATVLRELLSLKQFGLSPMQTAIYDELIEYLCG
ncbi:MAG: hypothetical protein H6822_01890 [Planctomycetaceae bacterium]|nr:hypothetical protein [Planctomycetales bacterium]MCB9920900.1 hypothetical protein [Planctomycetaceae bacterium]